MPVIIPRLAALTALAVLLTGAVLLAAHRLPGFEGCGGAHPDSVVRCANGAYSTWSCDGWNGRWKRAC